MNIFVRELKAHYKGLIGWSVGMIIFMWMCLIKYQTISVDPAAMSAILDQMSSTIKTIFGMNSLDTMTLGGYFGVCFLFIAILLAVHAALTGTGLLTIEPLTKTTEFLYTKPLSRQRIISAKLLSGLLQLLIVWGVTYLAALGTIAAYASLDGFIGTLAAFMGAAALIQIVCLTLGTMTAALIQSAQRAGKLLTGFIFASYALSLISQFDDWTWLRYVSIFRYFDAVDIIHANALQWQYAVICLIASVVALAVVYVRYPRRDLLS